MYVSGFWVTSIAFQASCNRCPSSSEYPQVRRFSALDSAESATAKNVTVSVYSVPFIMGFPHRCCQKRREAVTLPEVRDALFRDYMQGGNHRLSICLPIPFIIVPAHRHSLAGVPSSSSSMYSFLQKEGGRRERPRLFSPWHFTRASGGVRSYTRSPSLVCRPSLFPSFPGLP
jgi:hypothetical protein